MAAAKQTDQSTDTNQGPVLGPVDILGIIQRGASDLHAYCAQPWQHVDRDVCLGVLEHMARMLGHLPPMQKAQDKESERVRVN